MQGLLKGTGHGNQPPKQTGSGWIGIRIHKNSEGSQRPEKGGQRSLHQLPLPPAALGVLCAGAGSRWVGMGPQVPSWRPHNDAPIKPPAPTCMGSVCSLVIFCTRTTSAQRQTLALGPATKLPPPPMLAAALASLPPGLSSTPREEGQRRRPWQQGRGRLAVAAAQAAGGAPHPRIPAPQDTATRGPGSTKSAAKTSSSRPGLQVRRLGCCLQQRQGGGGMAGPAPAVWDVAPACLLAPPRSFTIGGVGLHTGEYAYVRVAPAFAGEGRYFVRVPTGTISPEWEADRPAPRRLDGARREVPTSVH